MKVILHCSDSTFGNAALIAKWHIERGWANIGYHLGILNGWLSSTAFNKHFDGHLETGRPLSDDNLLTPDEFGAHTLGENRDSVALFLIGKSGKFSTKQIKCLTDNALPLLKYQFGTIEISQHSDHDKKKPYCAGLRREFMEEINLKFN